MSDTADTRLDLDEQIVRIRRAQAESDTFVAEMRKLTAEQLKFATEQMKLAAEADKLRRERFLAPVIVAAGVAGAVGAIVSALLRLPGVGH